ncbi:MAG: hypothetical protein HC902_08730 [Calothrix sp. SM1_5_4]|nr:hypothetical protein [Calothrix sp. SM1_5_4]
MRTLKADAQVGGLLNSKSYGDHEILWPLDGDIDVIRVFRDKKPAAFEIVYHRGTHIVPGRTVIRRFVGPAQGAWRADTIDADTGEYLGTQGAQKPELDARDREIMKTWNVQLL